MVKIIATSDLHGKWRFLKEPHYKFPKADILVIAGDIFSNYSHFLSKDIELQMEELKEFDKWMAELPIANKLVISGNHDWVTDRILKSKLGIKNFTLLDNESIILNGIKFYGLPYTPEFCGWAWMKERNSHALRSVIERIPDDTNILISHGPPHGFLDISCYTYKNVGCELLKKKISKMQKLSHVFCGHIHGGFGKVQWGNTAIYNVSYVNEKYQPTNNPVLIEV